jgi:hypothetical protein
MSSIWEMYDSKFFEQRNSLFTCAPCWSCPAAWFLSYDVGEDFDALFQHVALLLFAER